jgi:hypothetical protein
MISADAERAAQFLARKHGEQAAQVAAARAEKLASEGEPGAAETWLLVARLLRAAGPTP